MIKFDAVQIVADDTNVFSNRLGEKVPAWAKRCRVQLVSSDSDWTFNLTMGGEEMARNAAPSRVQADNLQQADWQSPHYEAIVPRGATDFEILLNVNVVTAGVGIAYVQWES